MPVTLGTFEGLAGIARNIPPAASCHSGGVEDEVTFGTFNSSGTAVDMIGTGSDGGALEHVGVGHSHGACHRKREGVG